MTKKQCRQAYKQKRMELTPHQILRMHDLLLIQFQRLSFDDNAEYLLSYYPMADRAEIEPHLFGKSIQLSLPDLKIAYPVINYEDSTLQAHLVTETTVLMNNEYNIPEPVNGQEIDASILDIVFVPLLAFDRQGFRVGYGKGFYDRFLAQCRQDVIAIGFSYFDPVDNIDDANQFDIPLNYCITPQELYEF
ncbi:MAG: 5-formyltetrahydrofolate cyclo-ligase [Chitinophagaceae bacterium]|nr:5-formyltetrahydrofolate cyclo-ligase [Chitinophagaceae bacterium]